MIMTLPFYLQWLPKTIKIRILRKRLIAKLDVLLDSDNLETATRFDTLLKQLSELDKN